MDADEALRAARELALYHGLPWLEAGAPAQQLLAVLRAACQRLPKPAPEDPRQALLGRINNLITTLRAPGDQPPAPAPTAEHDPALTERLRRMEHEAQHRRELIDRLVAKAFEQGELINHLRTRLDSIHALTRTPGGAALPAMPEILVADEPLIIHDDGDAPWEMEHG